MKKTVYRWNPKEDITAHELALCLGLFMILIGARRINLDAEVAKLPENARRHFEKVEDE